MPKGLVSRSGLQTCQGRCASHQRIQGSLLNPAGVHVSASSDDSACTASSAIQLRATPSLNQRLREFSPRGAHRRTPLLKIHVVFGPRPRMLPQTRTAGMRRWKRSAPFRITPSAELTPLASCGMGLDVSGKTSSG